MVFGGEEPPVNSIFFPHSGYQSTERGFSFILRVKKIIIN